MAVQFNISSLNAACKGKLWKEGNSETQISKLLIDSRKLMDPATTVFFALVTSRNNAHKYIMPLYKKGVRVFVVSEKVDLPDDATVIGVKNTLQALQDMAFAHRKKMKYPVMAITGSNGKTIIKEWLFQVLHNKYSIARSPKSFNSQVGVPLSLSLMNDFNDLAIIEAGISKPEEMQKLANIILPELGIITNLGEAHSGGFENNYRKLKEKLLLFESCEKIFYCKDHKAIAENIENQFEDKELWSWSAGKEGKLSNVKSNNRNHKTTITGTFSDKNIEIAIPFTDLASIENACHVWLVALALGLDNEAILKNMRKLQAVEMRLNLLHGQQGSLLISDYYNSDPNSVKIALESLEQQRCPGKKVVVISAFEQIENNEAVYNDVFNMIAAKKVDILIAVGREWKRFADSEKLTVKWFENTEDLLSNLDVIPVKDSVILLKAARKFCFEKIAAQLVEKQHQTFLEVNLEALVENLNYYRSLLPRKTKIMAMVKAFSYGSGSTEIASVLQYNRVDYLGVAYIEEGVALRKAGMVMPIMVMNPNEQGFDKMIKYNLEPEIYSLGLLKAFVEKVRENKTLLNATEKKKFNVHVKIDTGMHRLGLTGEDLNLLPMMLLREPRISVVSVFTHLVGSDDAALDEFTKKQIAEFDHLTAALEDFLGYGFLRHILNSSGIVRFSKHAKDMVRLGIGLYGVDTSNQRQKNLHPVARLVTHISQVKRIKKGFSVGYGRAFVAKKDMQIATLPLGYADGYFRALGNGKGEVYIGGEIRPVIGNVCMDMCMVDVTGLNVSDGDEVELFGSHISVSDLAKKADTIPYEILAHISSRVPRVYVQAF